MSAGMFQRKSPLAIQAALKEFVQSGRTVFLARYVFGKLRDFVTRNPNSGELRGSKAIVGVAYVPRF